MPSINEPSNFSGRVNLAALVISKGGRTSRSFDSCFENFDGDAVATSLYRRAQRRPDSDLARNLWRYLSRDTVEAVAIENERRTNLAAWARELREKAEAASAAMWAKMEAERKARDAPSELTPAGEQLVIPGCERNLAPGKMQLDLFG